MRQYLVFAGHHYYPTGGWHDFVGSYRKLERAKDVAREQDGDWYQVVDSKTGEVVFS